LASVVVANPVSVNGNRRGARCGAGGHIDRVQIEKRLGWRSGRRKPDAGINAGGEISDRPVEHDAAGVGGVVCRAGVDAVGRRQKDLRLSLESVSRDRAQYCDGERLDLRRISITTILLLIDIHRVGQCVLCMQKFMNPATKFFYKRLI
jgi:hypothetical protein